MEAETETQIGYAELTIRVPAKVMRFIKEFLRDEPKEWIEQRIIEDLKADIEAMSGKEVIAYFELEDVLKDC